MTECCNRALYGWPLFHAWTGKAVVPCPGFIESDYDPGTYSPCADCNPNWSRVLGSPPPRARSGRLRGLSAASARKIGAENVPKVNLQKSKEGST